MILGIDTSSGTSVAAVDEAGLVLAELTESDTRHHAEAIGSLLGEALGRAGAAPADVTAVAIGMGPGPFTGLRVGIAAASAFAFARGVPLLRLVSHDAIAAAHYAGGASGPLLATTDARRRELYWSRYDGLDEAGIPCRVEGPGLAAADILAERFGQGGTTRLDDARVAAGALSRLALLVRERGAAFAGTEPLYLRSPDATPPLAPKRVSA